MAKAKARPKSRPRPRQVYLLKVWLKGRKRIWRRITIAAEQTLDDLHGAIYNAFDRYDEHLYSFYFLPPGGKGRGRLRHTIECTHPFNFEEGGLYGDRARGNAAKTKLSSLGVTVGQQFEYLFDFGDKWWHELLVERDDLVPDDGPYPRVVEKHGASPAQYPDLEDDEP